MRVETVQNSSNVGINLFLFVFSVAVGFVSVWFITRAIPLPQVIGFILVFIFSCLSFFICYKVVLYKTESTKTCPNCGKNIN